jgi:NTP pyrophosphatase (non-canonical NTP hydrolase)
MIRSLFLESGLLARAINHFGVAAQTAKAVEEMGELITAIARDYHRTNEDEIIDEIADVLITVLQLRLIYGAQRIDGRIAFKLERLDTRIASARSDLTPQL